MQALSEVIVRAGFVATVGCAMSCRPIGSSTTPGPPSQAGDRPDLPDEVVLEDGTVVRFVEQDVNAMPASCPGSRRGWISATSRSAAIRGRQHPAAGLRSRTRARPCEAGDPTAGVPTPLGSAPRPTHRKPMRSDPGFEEFAEFCESNRPAMMETFNRMGFGLFSPDVIQESLGKDGIRYRLHPRLGEQFVFTEFDVTREPTGMKWLMIR